MKDENEWGLPRKKGDRYDTEHGSWFYDPKKAYELHLRKLEEAKEEESKLEKKAKENDRKNI